jgi:alpha-1,2-mannosyltransferase
MASRAPSNRLPPSLGPDAEDGRATSANRLDAVARAHDWTWPVVSATIGALGVTILATVHRQIDLGTYLLGGAHALRPDLYRVLYQPTHLGFTYPPFAALLFAPLSHLPILFDQLVFSWLSLVALFGVIAVSIHVTCRTLGRRAILWWSLLLVTPVGLLDPVRETLLLGQVNIILALAVIADMTMVRPGRRGYLVGLAAAIKLTPLILVPYLLFSRQRGAWQRALASFVAAGALTALVAPSTSRTYWLHAVWRPNSAGWLPWVGNQGALGVTERLLHHGISATSTFVLVAGVTGVGLWIAVKAYQASSPLLGFLVIEATESIASPVSWSHHFVWVVLLIAWLALAPDRPLHGAWWAVLVAALFWAAPIWWVPHGSSVRYAGHGGAMVLADSFFIVMCAVLIAVAVRLIHRRGRRLSASVNGGAPHASI